MLSKMIIPVLTFIGVAAVLMGLYLYAENRYRRYLLSRRLLPESAGGRPLRHRLESPWHRLALRLGRLTIPKEEQERSSIRKLLTIAGYRSDQAVTWYFGLKLMLALSLGLIYLVLTTLSGSLAPRSLVLAFIPVAVGYYAPGLWLRHRINTRRRRIFSELPDVLDLLLICIEAGLSFDAALLRVSRELKAIAPVLSAEFGQFFFEINSGLPRRQVMTGLAQRNGEPGLANVVNVLLQSSRFGTDIAEALRTHIHSMRTERRQLAEEKGAKMSTRLIFPLVVLIMPALIIVILGPAALNVIEQLKDGF